MLRNIIIQRFIEDKVIKTIGHDFSVYIKGFFGLCIKLGILYFIQLALRDLLMDEYIQFLEPVVGAAGLILFLRYCVNFMNLYLDALTFTKRGVKLFTRESLLKHRTDEFEREHIQVVSSEQNTVRDKIFNRGCMHFALTNNFEFPFLNIDNPQKTVKVIYHYKDKFLSQQGYEQKQVQTTQEKEKFNMLVETLGEVVSEYMDKKNAPPSHF